MKHTFIIELDVESNLQPDVIEKLIKALLTDSYSFAGSEVVQIDKK